MLDLKPQYLAEVLAILQQKTPNKIVWAYGSRVSHTHHALSDLDLVVIDPKNAEKPLEHLMELREAFRDSHLPIRVDVMDWARIPEKFRNEISKRHEVILPSKEKSK